VEKQRSSLVLDCNICWRSSLDDSAEIKRQLPVG
jgi:hypothetical protein